jgi:putative membrane protein
MQRLGLISAAIAAIGVANTALADTSGGFGHMDGWGHGGVAMMFGPILWLIVLGGIVFAIIHYTQSNNSKNKPSDALEKLKMRLANGEIEPEEYEARRKLLEG